MRSITHRAIAAAVAGGLALASIGVTATEASAASRRQNNANAAVAFGAFAAMVGTIAAIAAANDRNDYAYGPYDAAPGPYYGSYSYGPSWRGHAGRQHWHR
jgi:hypothetical protein